MYRKALSIVSIFICALFIQCSNKSDTDISKPIKQDTGKYAESRLLFREIMSIGSKVVKDMEASDLEVVKIDIDLVGKGNPKKTLKIFSKEFSYIITVLGQPTRVKDTDLRIYYLPSDDSPPIPITKDDALDYAAVIRFDPPASGTYMLVTDAYEMEPGYEDQMGFYFMVIAHN